MTKYFSAFSILGLWCAALLALRVIRSGSPMYLFLAWNLFLATVPFAAAVAFSMVQRATARAAWFGVWLLFLPNAPYIVTDFLHLRARNGVPLWFDIALLASYAGAGLLLGYVSVALVQASISRRFGEVAGWCTALTALFLSGFGIYLGRFLRWNSWDALLAPAPLAMEIAHRVIDPFAHPRTFAVTLIYGAALAVGYVALQLVSKGDTSSAAPRTPPYPTTI